MRGAAGTAGRARVPMSAVFSHARGVTADAGAQYTLPVPITG